MSRHSISGLSDKPAVYELCGAKLMIAFVVMLCSLCLCGCGTSAPATIMYESRVSPAVIAAFPPEVLAGDRRMDPHFGEWVDNGYDFACFDKVTSKEVTKKNEKHLEIEYTDESGSKRHKDVTLDCPGCFYQNRVTIKKGLPERITCEYTP